MKYSIAVLLLVGQISLSQAIQSKSVGFIQDKMELKQLEQGPVEVKAAQEAQ